MFTDLLFYQAAPADAEMYMTRRGVLERLRQHSGWRSSWTRIVPGRFGGRGLTDLLFYDASAGVGEIYRQRGPADFVLFKSFSGWRGSWTHIVPGQFGGDGLTDLLFYDASAGQGEFSRATGNGLVRMRTHDGWRGSWTHIVPGNFGGDGLTDLLFYDAGAGQGEFYAVTGNGISQLHTHSGWRSSWTAIIPGAFGADGRTDLYFYDRTGGVGECYAVTAAGISQLQTYTDWRGSWTHIVPGQFAPARCLHLHLRVLQAPSRFTIDTMLDGMRQVYATAGIRVSVSTQRTLNLPQLLTVAVGSCSDGFGDNISGDVAALYRNRGDVSDKDVAIFFVQATVPALNGCAKHPSGRPGAIVTSGASQWTLGHEVGHVLGLRHVGGNTRLMFDGGTDNIVNLPPDLADNEIVRFHQTRFVHDH